MMYTAVMILAAGYDNMPILPAGRISVTQQMVAASGKAVWISLRWSSVPKIKIWKNRLPGRAGFPAQRKI